MPGTNEPFVGEHRSSRGKKRAASGVKSDQVNERQRGSSSGKKRKKGTAVEEACLTDLKNHQ